MTETRSFRIKLMEPDLAHTLVAEIIVDTTAEGAISDVEICSGAEYMEIEEVTDAQSCEVCDATDDVQSSVINDSIGQTEQNLCGNCRRSYGAEVA